MNLIFLFNHINKKQYSSKWKIEDKIKVEVNSSMLLQLSMKIKGWDDTSGTWNSWTTPRCLSWTVILWDGTSPLGNWKSDPPATPTGVWTPVTATIVLRRLLEGRDCGFVNGMQQLPGIRRRGSAIFLFFKWSWHEHTNGITRGISETTRELSSNR